MAPFPPPAHRTGQADFPHPALGLNSLERPRWAGTHPRHLRVRVKLSFGSLGRVEVARLSPIARPSTFPTAFQNQGPFARPALPGVHTTTDLSATPYGPTLSLTGCWLTVAPPPLGFPVLRWSPGKHAVATTPVGPWSPFAHVFYLLGEKTYTPQRRPSPFLSRVGSHITLFEACSAFTHVTACLLAESPYAILSIEGSDRFVTSSAASIASG